MASSGYTPWSVTAGEVPTTAYWNILGSNDASFNSGTGINDSAIITRHIAAHNVSNITYVYNEVAGPNIAGAAQAIGNAWTTVTGWSGNSFTTNGGDITLDVMWSNYKATATGGGQYRIQLNGSATYPSGGFTVPFDSLNVNQSITKKVYITGLPASTYTVAFQALSQSGTVNFFANDWLTIIATEYLR